MGRSDAGRFTLNVPTMDALYAELRDRVVIALDVDQIAEVVYADTTVTRDPDGQIHARGKAIDSDRAGKLLDELAGLRAEHFLPDDAVKLDKTHPTHTLKITTRLGKTMTLSIWDASANDYHVAIGRVNGGPMFTMTGDPVKAATRKPADANGSSMMRGR